MEKHISNILKDKLIELNSIIGLDKKLNHTAETLLEAGNCLFTGDSFKRHYIIEVLLQFDTKDYIEHKLIKGIKEYEGTTVTMNVGDNTQHGYVIKKALIYVYKLHSSNSKITYLRANLIFTLMFSHQVSDNDKVYQLDSIPGEVH